MKETNRLIPIHSDSHNFVPGFIPETQQVGTVSVKTAPLVFGKAMSLLGLCFSEELAAVGLVDQSDSVDPAVALKSVVVKVPGFVMGTHQLVKISVEDRAGTQFVPLLEGSERKLELNIDHLGLTLSPNMTDQEGKTLDYLRDGSKTLFELVVRITGTVNLETSVVDLVAEVADSVDSMELRELSVIGYELIAYRRNVNERTNWARVE